MSHFNQLIELDEKQIIASQSNTLSATDFLSLNEALINILNDKGITLSELGNNSPAITFNQPNNDFLTEDDYINYDTTNQDELKLFYKNQLIEKLIGTDVYYLSTNSENQILSGKYVTAQNKAYNFLNINNATTYSIPVSSRLFEKDIGGFFLPPNYSILRTVGKYNFYVKDTLEPNKIYSFPDPNVQGNISGLSKVPLDTPFNFTPINDNFKNISSSYGRRGVKSSYRDQNFYSYDSVEQKRVITVNKNLSTFKDSFSQLANTGYVSNINDDVNGNRFFEIIQDPTVVQTINPDFKLQSGDFTNSGSLSSKSNLFYNSLSSVSTSINAKKNTIKQIYCYNKYNNTFQPLSAEFNDIFLEYKPDKNVYEELINSVTDVKIYNDVYTFKTPSYYLIDFFTYKKGIYKQTPQLALIIDNSEDIKTQNMFGLSNDFVVNNHIYKVKVKRINNGRQDNSLFYYEFFSYDILNKKVVEIINEKITLIDFFYENFNLDLDRAPQKIVNVSLSHNSKFNAFVLIVQYNDLNENIFLHSLTFKIRDTKLFLVDNEIYTPENYYETSDFYTGNELTSNYTSVSLTLDNPTIQDSEQGVILI
jgi:hypothetical protein